MTTDTPPTPREIHAAQLVILRAKLAALQELAELRARLDQVRATAKAH